MNENPRERGLPTSRRPTQTPGAYTSHETYMRQLGRQIAWLQTHEHWWIRWVRGKAA